ncbi:hypothetical protein [Aestuariibacter sp. A3R04]|uniref:hypothetical protein n=1 Tax=Aestuariibacter sp. A3R04 TaxID=2841571 RepID=UPI001C0A3C89|nr:hypothetical protein [Aestuariibacter sp. A3R04]MBU3023107.1 hypothetical protein [Aestuariibacter sp. A3R04]
MLKAIREAALYDIIKYGVLAIIGLISAYFATTGQFFSWYLEVATVPRWFLFLLVFSLFATISALVLLIYRWRKQNENFQWFSFESYNKAKFNGIVWDWAYEQDGSIYDFEATCPKCHGEVTVTAIPKGDEWLHGVDCETEGCSYTYELDQEKYPTIGFVAVHLIKEIKRVCRKKFGEAPVAGSYINVNSKHFKADGRFR